jgi:hypothetical protein
MVNAPQIDEELVVVGDVHGAVGHELEARRFTKRLVLQDLFRAHRALHPSNAHLQVEAVRSLCILLPFLGSRAVGDFVIGIFVIAMIS